MRGDQFARWQEYWDTMNRIRIIYPSRSQVFSCKFRPISSVERQKERLCSSYYRSSVNDGCVQLSGRNRPVCSGALQGADPGAVSSWGSWCLTGSPQFTLAANAQQEVFRHWLSSSGTDLPAWSLSLKQCHPATICMYMFRVCVSLLIIIVGDISVTASSVFIQVYSSCCCCLFWRRRLPEIVFSGLTFMCGAVLVLSNARVRYSLRSVALLACKLKLRCKIPFLIYVWLLIKYGSEN